MLMVLAVELKSSRVRAIISPDPIPEYKSRSRAVLARMSSMCSIKLLYWSSVQRSIRCACSCHIDPLFRIVILKFSIGIILHDPSS